MIRPFLGYVRAPRFFPVVAISLPLLVLSAATRPAFAQTDAALAETLFREGKRLMAEKRFAEACPKFAESYRLDPGLGTLLNLASCYEAEGKLASAWAQYSEALARARRDGDADRAAFAEERVKALEPKLPKLTVAVSPEAQTPGLVIKLDGRELNTAVLGVPVPVDPGMHQLEASAPGKQPWRQTIKAEPQTPMLSVTVPRLTDAPQQATGPAPAAPPPSTQPYPVQQPAPQQAAPERKTNTGAIVAGVATGVFTVGAIATGILYSGKRSDFEKKNEELDPKRFDERDSAQTLGIINLVMVGGALVSGGLTIYFLASGAKARDAQPATAKLHVLPEIGPQGGALSIRGSL